MIEAGLGKLNTDLKTPLLDNEGAINVKNGNLKKFPFGETILSVFHHRGATIVFTKNLNGLSAEHSGVVSTHTNVSSYKDGIYTDRELHFSHDWVLDGTGSWLHLSNESNKTSIHIVNTGHKSIVLYTAHSNKEAGEKIL